MDKKMEQSDDKVDLEVGEILAEMVTVIPEMVPDIQDATEEDDVSAVTSEVKAEDKEDEPPQSDSLKNEEPAPMPLQPDVLTDISSNLEQMTIIEKEVQTLKNEEADNRTADKKDAGDEAMRQILAQYKALALQTENHPILMKDSGSLMMLVLSLGNKSSEVVFEGLAILHLLSQKVENRRSLFKTLHMMDALVKIVEDNSHSEEIVTFAALIHDVLKKAPSIPPSKCEKSKGKGKSTRAKAQDVKKMNRSMSKSKSVYLYIPYNIFFKEKRNTITQTLQQDKDVLSITFDMNKCLCVIRVKNHALPETFGKMVANLGFECYLVALNEKNEEVKIQMMGDSQLGKDVYEYLSESDEENNKSLEEKALATAEDVKRRNEKQSKGWFASAANLVQKSIFW